MCPPDLPSRTSAPPYECTGAHYLRDARPSQADGVP